MQEITLPKNIKYIPKDKNCGTFVIEGCYPGYGTTLGNALRRVILSSLPGAAIVNVKIKGVSHEFSTIPGVKEDIVQIILNLKKIRLRLHKESATIKLSVSGKKQVNAGAIKCPSDVEIVNPETPIATLTGNKSKLEMEMEVNQGLGYVPIEQFDKSEKKIGVIDIDAIYTPVKRVNYAVENMRVGKRTDFGRLSLEIETDSTKEPREALLEALEILIKQFESLAGLKEGAGETLDKKEKSREKAELPGPEEKSEKESAKPEEIKVSDLKGLSSRTLNVLEENEIFAAGDLTRLSEDELKSLKGMGDKGLKEIRKAIGGYGLTLKS